MKNEVPCHVVGSIERGQMKSELVLSLRSAVTREFLNDQMPSVLVREQAAVPQDLWMDKSTNKCAR